MYRAVFLCALVLLVAAPSINSVQAANVKSHGAAGAAGSGTVATRWLERAGRALLAEAGDAATAKPAEHVAAEANKPAADAAKGDAAAAAAPAAAAPSKDAAAQQPAAEQPKAATPTVMQPATPQPMGEQQQAAAQEEQEEASAGVASVDSRGEEAVRPAYYEPGVSRSGYRSSHEYDSINPYAPNRPYTDYRTGPAPYYGGAAPYRQPATPGYGGPPGSHNTNSPEYREYDSTHGEYEESQHEKKHEKEEEKEKEKEKHEDKKMHHTGKAAKKLAKAKNGDKYLSDDSSYSHDSSKSSSYSQEQAVTSEQPEQVSSQSLVQPEQAGTQAAYHPTNKPYVDGPYANTPPSYYNTPGPKSYTDGTYPTPGSYSTYEAETPGYNPKDKSHKEDKEMHHTGKAAKKLAKAKNGEKYLSDDGTYTQAGTQGTAATAPANPMSDKEREKVQKLQKYYAAEAELLAAELEEGDDAVSAFARPSRYSNKAAKYAAMALKAQAAKKVPVLQPQMQVQVQGAPLPAQQPAAAAAPGDASKPTLANFAANLLKKKPSAADKASVLTAPKPTLKMQKAADAELQATAEEFTADEEVSWEDYMANPQLYAGMPARTTSQQPVVILTHEQFNRAMNAGGKKPHGKKDKTAAAQQAAARAMANNAKGSNHAKPAYAVVQGDDEDSYSSYEPYGYGQGDSWEKDAPFDMEHNYHPPLRRKEMKNTYNFRAMRNTESTVVGLTRGGLPTGDPTTFPVVLAYEAKMTCGPEPGPAGGIGTCRGTGIAPNLGANMVMMSFTCTIDADASNVCGLKYVQGMTITAQGMVNIEYARTGQTITTNPEVEVTSLEADVIPITGVYVPGRRTTLLADVVTLLSGVKGGSLMLRSDGDSGGHFSFYFWR